MFVTFEVSKWDKSNLVKDSSLANMYDMSVTLSVLKVVELDKSIFFSFLFLLNMFSMLVTSEVSRLSIPLMVSKFSRLVNKSAAEPIILSLPVISISLISAANV